MKSILLIGVGRFGRHIVRKLNAMNHQVMAVDQNEDRIQSVLPSVTSAQIGDSTNEEFLSSLGISNFDACIVTIGDDFQNSLETVYLLKELGARKIIARASREIQEKFLLRNGADEIVYPEKQLASWTAIRYSSDHIFDYIELDEDYAIIEVGVPSAWVGRTIGKLDIRRTHGINIMATKIDGKMNMNITADYIFSEGETILVLGKNKEIQKCFRI